MKTIRAFSDAFIASRLLVWLAFAGCMFAFIIGTWGWYGEFFAEVNAPLWAYPFIPDCPLAAGVFGVALLLMHYKRGNNLLNQIAAVFCIKYGVWTMSFWALYWARTGNIEMSSLFSGPVMFVTHLGLFIMGLLLLQYVRPSVRDSAITLAWFVASDLVDYLPIASSRSGGFGFYPPLPAINGDVTALVPAMLLNAVVMTWLVAGGLLVRALRHQRRITVASATTLPAK